MLLVDPPALQGGGGQHLLFREGQEFSSPERLRIDRLMNSMDLLRRRCVEIRHDFASRMLNSSRSSPFSVRGQEALKNDTCAFVLAVPESIKVNSQWHQLPEKYNTGSG